MCRIVYTNTGRAKANLVVLRFLDFLLHQAIRVYRVVYTNTVRAKANLVVLKKKIFFFFFYFHKQYRFAVVDTPTFIPVDSACNFGAVPA